MVEERERVHATLSISTQSVENVKLLHSVKHTRRAFYKTECNLRQTIVKLIVSRVKATDNETFHYLCKSVGLDENQL